MKLVIEGVDGTFKSTIAKKLSEKYSIPITRGSSFEIATGTNEELYNFSLSLTELDNYIIERSIYSNLVYATLYPKYTILSYKQKRKLEDKMRDNSIIIYLTASVDTIIDRIEQRGDDYITTDKIAEIIGMYNKVMSDAVSNGMKVYTYDTGILSSDDIVEQISQLLFTNKNSPYIYCEDCKKQVERKNSFFSGTHCFGCYEKIMLDIFSRG